MKVTTSILLVVTLATINPVCAPTKKTEEDSTLAAELDTTDFKPMTPQEWKEEMNGWINDYFVRFDQIQRKKPFNINKDITIIKELMLYNWMHYLKPQLTKHVLEVLPKYLKKEKSTDVAEEKIKQAIIKYGEESVTMAIVRYQYAAPPQKSIHDQMTEELKKSLTTLFQAAVDEYKKMMLKGDSLKVYNIMRDRDIANDPVILVHDLDLLMCLQSVYLTFYPDYEEEKWGLKPTDVNGKTIEMIPVETTYLTKKTWKFFSELEMDNIKKEIVQGILETLKLLEETEPKNQ